MTTERVHSASDEDGIDQGGAFCRLVAEYVDRLNAGEQIDPVEIIANHPEHGEAILQELKSFVAVGKQAPQEPLGTLGDYTLRRQIGRGGMGVVYEAWQNSMDRQVALKVLPVGFAADHKAFSRFMREAKTAGILDHRNVVSVHAAGFDENTPYYAMEYVHGVTLAELAVQLRDTEPEEDTPFGRKNDVAYFGKLARAFAEVADGLQHAHSKGVTHRDIKPSNLILDGEGKLRILDFGLARLEGQESLTLSGDLMGTVLYMSPEQAMARRVPIDYRTDIYSLGATMYEVLTGRPPFRGKTSQDTLSEIIFRDPPTLRSVSPGVPRDLETIVLKCMRKDPRDRYRTVGALSQDLDRFVHGDPVEARPQAGWEKLTQRVRRNRARLLAAVAALLFVSAVAVSTYSVLEGERLERVATVEAEVRRTYERARELKIEAGTVRQQRLGRLRDALATAETAGNLLTEEVDDDLRRRVMDLEAELQSDVRDARMVEWLEWLPLFFCCFQTAAYATTYQDALRDYGLDIDVLTAEELAERIAGTSIALELTFALDVLVALRGGAGSEWRGREKLAEAAATVDPDPDWHRVRRAVLANDLGTLQDCARAMDVETTHDRRVAYLAACLFDRGDPNGAEELLRRAYRHQPGSYWINNWLGLVVGEGHQLDESFQYLRGAIATRPGDPHPYLDLAYYCVYGGREEQALTAFTDAVDKGPEYSVTYFFLLPFLQDLLAGERKRSLDGALAELIQTFDDLLSSGLDLHVLGRRSFVAAWSLHPGSIGPERPLEIARREVEETARRDPDALGLLAQVQAIRGDHKKAVRLLEEALRLEGEVPVYAVKLLGSCRAALSPDLVSYASIDGALDQDARDQDSRRIADFQTAARSDPAARTRLAYLEGRLLEREGRHLKAAGRFEEVLAVDKTLPEPFLRLAESLRAAGEPGRAEKVLRELLESSKPSVADQWNAWITILQVDLGRTPAQILAAFPRAKDEYAEDLRWLLDRLQQGEALRINCGGEAYTGADGVVWGHDRFWRGGGLFCSGASSNNVTIDANRALIQKAGTVYYVPVVNTEDGPLYATERTFPPSARPGSYRVPLPRGDFRVTLHFAEIYPPNVGPGYRRFDVLLEGRRVLENHDPFDHAGYAKAYSLPFRARVEDGVLDITFVQRAASPKISAIEIERLDE